MNNAIVPGLRQRTLGAMPARLNEEPARLNEESIKLTIEGSQDLSPFIDAVYFGGP